MLLPDTISMHEAVAAPLSTVTLLSFAALSALYHILAPRYPSAKQISWIITTISSAIMIIASVPFLYDYVANGGSVKHVRTLPIFSMVASRFFQAYLAADLALGVVYYRAQLSPLTGWFHHMFYILVVEMAVRRSWTHIFCLCAAMEIPTFILGIMALYPHLRSNVLFAVAFFSTRIMLHIVLAVSYLHRDNRAHATGGSYVPAGILVAIFPLHAMWFYGCLKGFKKRASAAQPKPIPAVISLDVYSVDPRTNPNLPHAEDFQSSPAMHNGEPGAEHVAVVSSIQGHSAMPKYARRLAMRSPERYSGQVGDGASLKLATIEDSDSQSSMRRASRREIVFDFVGLGRGSKQSQ